MEGTTIYYGVGRGERQDEAIRNLLTMPRPLR